MGNDEGRHYDSELGVERYLKRGGSKHPIILGEFYCNSFYLLYQKLGSIKLLVQSISYFFPRRKQNNRGP